jgi:tetratricopeptide (TPR) repeat protein
MTATATAQAPLAPPDDALPSEDWQLESQLPQLRASGQYALAAALGERLVELREAAYGEAHARTQEAIGALAESYYQISQYDRAEALLERLLDALDEAESPDPAELGHALSQLAKVSRALGLLDRSEQLYRRAIAIYNKAPEGHSIGLAAAFQGLSSIFEHRGQLAPAESMCRAGLTIREEAFGKEALQVAESVSSLAIVYRRKRQFDEAERLYRRAIAIHEAQQGSDHPGVVSTLVNLGILHSEKGEHEKAGPVLARAAALLEARSGPADSLMANVLDALGAHHEITGDAALAIDAARRTLSIREELLAPSHPHVAIALNNLGTKLFASEETRDEAEALFRRALKVVGDTPLAASFGTTLLNLAVICATREDLGEAEALATRALTLARASGGPDGVDAADALVALSLIAEQGDDLGRAAMLMMEAFIIRAKRPQPDQTISDLTRIGTLLLATDKLEEASKFLERALAQAASSRGKDHPSVAHLMYLSGKLALAQKQWKQALFCLDRALAITEKAKGRMHEDLVAILHLIGDADLGLGKLGAAEAAYKRIGEIYAKSQPNGAEVQGVVPTLLGDVAMKRKAFARAADLFEEALTLAEAAFGKDHLRLRVLLDKAAEAHLKNENLPRTEELSRRLLAILERHVAPDHSALVPSFRRLAAVYLQTGDARAEEMIKRTVRSLDALTKEAEAEAETRKMKADRARRKGLS